MALGASRGVAAGQAARGIFGRNVSNQGVGGRSRHLSPTVGKDRQEDSEATEFVANRSGAIRTAPVPINAEILSHLPPLAPASPHST